MNPFIDNFTFNYFRKRLGRIERRLKAMATTEQELDDAITAVGSTVTSIQDTVTAIQTAVTAILVKLGGATNIDLSDEVAALSAVNTSLTDASTSLSAAAQTLSDAAK